VLIAQKFPIQLPIEFGRRMIVNGVRWMPADDCG